MSESLCNILSNKIKYWTFDGKIHRIDGPAFEGIDGTNGWYLFDKPHRTNGPALNGALKYNWCYNGEKIL